jgi:hydrogenase small subunit
VQQAAVRASQVICAGTCAAFGGIPAAGANPTQAISVQALTGRPTINVSGCPVNPDWIVWTIVQVLLGKPVSLDADGRPSSLYATAFSGQAEPSLIHDKCPRNPDHHGTPLATAFGQAGLCLQNLGCRGPFTKARCEAAWNGVGGAQPPHPHPGHWCIGVNAPCHGCVEKAFPGSQSFFESFIS